MNLGRGSARGEVKLKKVANDNLKKPNNDNKVPEIQEEEDKRKKIIILVILIVVVLVILIGTAYYFSNSGKDKEDKDKGKNPGNVVKPEQPEKEDKPIEPVVDNNTSNVIVYRPVKRPVIQEPTVQEVPTTVTGSEDDSSVIIDFDEETKTINVSGTSKYVAKVNENFGEGFNNIVQVKISLNTKYKKSDLENMDFTITTDVENGKKNYFLDKVQEDENGNLYFYWLQAVGRDFDVEPKLTINYGDGCTEEYTMDLSNLAVQTPSETGAELAKALVSTQENGVVVGGKTFDLNYELTVLEEVLLKDVQKDENDTPIVASETDVDNNGSDSINSDVTSSSDTNTSENLADKKYILKVTGIDKEDAYTEDAAINLGFKGYKYIIAVKLYAPVGFENNPDSISKIVFDKSRVDGESKVTDVTMGNSDNYPLVLHEDKENRRYYIVVTMAVDGVYPGNNPYVSINWDSSNAEQGTLTYIFDFSEFDYVEPKVSETPEDTIPPVDGGEVKQGEQGTEENLDALEIDDSEEFSDGDVTRRETDLMGEAAEEEPEVLEETADGEEDVNTEPDVTEDGGEIPEHIEVQTDNLVIQEDNLDTL